MMHCNPVKKETIETSNVEPDFGRRGRHSGFDGGSGSDNGVSMIAEMSTLTCGHKNLDRQADSVLEDCH